MRNTFLSACELKNKLTAALFLASLLMFSAVTVAQEHSPSQLAAAPAQQAHAPEAEHAAGHSITDMILGMGWPIANFIIFVGVIYYFGNGPLKEYLATRGATIRKDLVEAAALKASATAQLATIEQKLQALPGDLSA